MTVEKYVRILHRIKDPECSEKEIETYIKDWKRRSKIFLGWLKNIPKESRILDCGCGVGISGAILKEMRFNNIVGIDIDERNVNAAKTFYKVYKMNCENIKFRPNTFDVVLALNIIEHLNDPKKFIRNIKKILKNGGYSIFSLPNEIWFRKILGLTPRDPTHKQSWSCFSFKKFLKNNGFEVLDMRPAGIIPFLFACQTFMVLVRLIK